METFFILGRNPELSRVEILEFLKTRNRTHKEILFEKNLLIIETNEDEKFNIQEFGGTIHLGKILAKENIQEYIDKNEIIPADKFSYAIFGNQDPQIFKDKFKERKKKAMIKHGGKQIKFQDGHKEQNPKADFYIFFHSSKNQQLKPNTALLGAKQSGSKAKYFGIVSQTYNSAEVSTRDMQKPIRRESLAISPRLSKILINLSGAKPHDKLLDPFCGIGAILQEALVKNINVYGIDKDKQATIDAKKNLNWLTKNFPIKTKKDTSKTRLNQGKLKPQETVSFLGTYKIENKDSRNAPDLQFNALATETPLGKILRKKPNENEAKQIILNFEAYIIPILKKLKLIKKPNAKIAITFPIIQNLHVNAQKIANKCNLKIYINPIQESRTDQFISRDILVLQ